MPNSAASKNKAVDPVCGMTVEPVRTGLVVAHAGCRYYFCAEACRKAFESKPDQYLGNKKLKRKGFWGRYLSRLEKSTGGKSLKCH